MTMLKDVCIFDTSKKQNAFCEYNICIILFMNLVFVRDLLNAKLQKSKIFGTPEKSCQHNWQDS